MEKQIPFKFDIQFDDTFAPTNDPSLKRGKVRVFYKGLNRNFSYITPEFAQHLIDTADLKPIVGTYLYQEKDFGGHEQSTDKRAYGTIVPHSATWEDHVDCDGVRRTYATFEVVIWTEYWDEAKTIFEKGQSMELDKNTIKGEWKSIIYNDMETSAYVYTDGAIKGLCVLGKNHEACFEGAAFFNVENEDYLKFTRAMEKYFNGGKDAMDENKVEAPVENEVQEEEQVEETVQPETPAEAEVSVPAESEEVKEEDAPAAEEAEPEVEHEAAAEETEPAAEEEPSAETSEDFEGKYNELLEQYNALMEQYNALVGTNNALQTDYEQMENDKATLNELFEAVKADNVAKEETIASYTARIQKYEQKEKDALVEKFSKCLPESIIQQIEEEKDKMSYDDLNTRMAMEYTSFSLAKEHNENIRVPQVPDEDKNSFAALLSKYKK